jgi:hypothetical protein
MKIEKYVIQIRRFKKSRWENTTWTWRGKPVLIRAARKALARARGKFPQTFYNVEYRIKQV